MKSDAENIFDHYDRHYSLTESVDRLPNDLERLKRDRIPRCLAGVSKETRILDAGCAQGHLLAALQRVGYASLHGVDISESLINQARTLLGEGARLQVSDIQSFLGGQPEGSFDVIFFHDVLEHVPRDQTIDMLRMFYRALSDNGMLSLRVPNMASLLASYNAHIDFTHVNQFAEYALLQVLEQAGFQVSKIRFEPQSPILFWSWRRPHRAVFRVLNRLRWHLNNGLHRLAYRLSDVTPMPTVFDFNLMITARK
jgi:2-polyprenyl-3-methyl-5-hydroxy-6-metoxy-1,4-benzoquinol methylase